MMLNYELKGKKYLEKNLLPLMQNIKVKKSDSLILGCLDIQKVSINSFHIQFGIRLEKFWNKVISDSLATNLIEKNNIIKIKGKSKQQDHFFTINNEYYYLESKCNLTLDSEKTKTSNKKVKDISEKHRSVYNNVTSGYFIPTTSVVDPKTSKKYHKDGINVFGVKWLISIIGAPFTDDEYESFLKNEVSSFVQEKGLI